MTSSAATTFHPFTEQEVEEILALNVDTLATAAEGLTGKLRLSLTVPPHLLDKLAVTFGIAPLTSPVPAQMIKGDIAPHKDAGPAPFESTYLLYLTDSPGQLIVEGAAYPIEKGAGYAFASGLEHGTTGTEGAVRISLGPFNEIGVPVGRYSIQYYLTEAAALAGDNTYIAGGGLTLGTIDFGDLSGITSWRISPSSTGPSSQSQVYSNGDTLEDAEGFIYYNVYPAGEPEPEPAAATVPSCLERCGSFGSDVQTANRAEADKTHFVENKAILVGQSLNPRQFPDYATYLKYITAKTQVGSRSSYGTSAGGGGCGC